MEINQDHPTFGKYSNMPQRYGWAPGNYSNKCYKCGETFQCDKLAIECADCAYKDEEENG